MPRAPPTSGPGVPGSEIVIGGLTSGLRRATILADGRPVKFRQRGRRLVLYDLPRANPDRIAQMAVLKLQFASRPRQALGALCVET